MTDGVFADGEPLTELVPGRGTRKPVSRMSLLILFVSMLLVSAPFAAAHDHDHDHDHEDMPVTCGSVVKLVNVDTHYHLHSHSINWGSGSGQQSVTAFEGGDDANSYWTIKPAYGAPNPLEQASPVPCGSTIRLQHLMTKRFLHSHLHSSPLSRNQEISCFGDERGTSSDEGDNWIVECSTEQWMRDEPVRLKHYATGQYLFTSKDFGFNQVNCRNCPIQGQLEISAVDSPRSGTTEWHTDQGIYFDHE